MFTLGPLRIKTSGVATSPFAARRPGEDGPDALFHQRVEIARPRIESADRFLEPNLGLDPAGELADEPIAGAAQRPGRDDFADQAHFAGSLGAALSLTQRRR